MAYDFSSFETRTAGIITWLQGEYVGLRTGRATPALLDSVRVEAYGARMPLNQVGSVMVEDARTLRVSVWDASTLRTVEKAIIDADLGVSVAADQTGLRVMFPELTSERRVQLLKIAKSKLEEARVSVRAARDEVVKNVDAKNKAGELSDDEKFKCKEDLQKRVDARTGELGKLFELKEREISE